MGPSGRIAFFWNVPFRSWTTVPVFDRHPAVPDDPHELGDIDVLGACTYRMTFAIPEVRPASYPVLAIEHARGSAAALSPMTLQVTA